MIGLLLAIAVVATSVLLTAGIIRWKKNVRHHSEFVMILSLHFNLPQQKKSKNALEPGRRIYERPSSLSNRRVELTNPNPPLPARQSYLYSIINGRESNGDIRVQPSQLFAFVESPNDVQYSAQSSMSYGDHSRNTSSVLPMDKQLQFSPISSATVSPTHSFHLANPPQDFAQDFVTQMQIPWNDPGHRQYDTLPMQSAQVSSTPPPVPLIDPEGHHLPPRPFAPTPVSVPPMVSNSMFANLNNCERPNSAQTNPHAPSYRNPPGYTNPMWSNTLPLPNRQPKRTEVPGLFTGQKQEQEPIWDIV